MSCIDLATLATHRRQELQDRLRVFEEKCDRAVGNIIKLKEQAQSFPNLLICDPTELKDKFLSCMKQLDEYNYLITDFNLALDNLDSEEKGSTNYVPVHDNPNRKLQSPLHPIPSMNLMDALSEPLPSTSKAYLNSWTQGKPTKKKLPKEDLLISFSSSSSESVPNSKCGSEVQSIMRNREKQLTLEENAGILPAGNFTSIAAELNLPASVSSTTTNEDVDLPAQEILEGDHVYRATITHVDGHTFYVITEDFEGAHDQMMEMIDYYKDKNMELSLDELMSLNYCTFYDVESGAYYRALFIRLTKEDMSVAEVFLVDTGETILTPTENILPLPQRFRVKPPLARFCHLAGLDLQGYPTKEQELFLNEFMNKLCRIKVDDNASESLGVYVTLLSGESLNDLMVQQGLAGRIDRSLKIETDTSPPVRGLTDLEDASLDITDCPEYEDPLLAVTGYHNRDEMDICKHYKGGPEKTCFKGSRCTKKHILPHPDGWTSDKVPVLTKVPQLLLPPPGTFHNVYVTYVAHFDRFYVHLLNKTANRGSAVEVDSVGLPLTTLNALVRAMNTEVSRNNYKCLKLAPALCELVAALYPMDDRWYRAKVLTVAPLYHKIEVMFIDYGTQMWVKEDDIRELESRYWSLPAQAVPCVLAGVKAKSENSRQWVDAREALKNMIHEHVLQARIISREYDSITVELFDEHGFSVAEQLVAAELVLPEPYEVVDDTHVTQKVVIP